MKSKKERTSPGWCIVVILRASSILVALVATMGLAAAQTLEDGPESEPVEDASWEDPPDHEEGAASEPEDEVEDPVVHDAASTTPPPTMPTPTSQDASAPPSATGLRAPDSSPPLPEDATAPAAAQSAAEPIAKAPDPSGADPALPPNAPPTSSAAASAAPRFLRDLPQGALWAASIGGGAIALTFVRRQWWLAALPLYSRLAPSRVLEHATRSALAELLRDEPGITFREAQRRLGIATGEMTHHARVLERAGVIFSSPDGQQRRLFLTTHGRVPPVPPVRERALDAIASSGPVTNAELAHRLGVSREAMRYHVKSLAREGAIVARAQGRELIVALPEARARGEA